MEERMYLLMAKMLSNEATGEERRELQDWLEASADNRTAFDEVKALWQKTDSVIQESQFNFNAAWEKVAARTVDLEETSGDKTTIVRPMRKWWAISAAAAGLIIIALVYQFMLRTDMISTSAKGSMMAITLPDQTKVNLMPGSTIRYPETFDGDTRNVALKGEAFFEVTRNEQQPFIIDAQSAEVKVLGTSFNVNCNDTAATVAVRTGKVQMSLTADPEQKVLLTRGNKGVYENHNLVTTVDTNYIYYSSGVLNLNQLTLEQAVAVISKVKNVTIVFDNKVTLADRQQIINIRFKNYTLAQMLDELSLMTKLKWKKENNRYVIYAQ